MTRRPSTFKQRDVTAALKAAFAAGAVRARVEVNGITVIADKVAPVVLPGDLNDRNEWDGVPTGDIQ